MVDKAMRSVDQRQLTRWVLAVATLAGVLLVGYSQPARAGCSPEDRSGTVTCSFKCAGGTSDTNVACVSAPPAASDNCLDICVSGCGAYSACESKSDKPTFAACPAGKTCLKTARECSACKGAKP
jgi:hypothetical protein